MSLTSSEMTPADIAAVSGGNGMFGGDGAWWIIILFLFLFNNGGMGGANQNYVLNSDFSTLSRQIDSQTGELMRQTNQIANGLCDGFYTQAQLVNGTNMNMANGFANAELSRSNQQAALMAQLNTMQMAQQNCCCENRSAIADVNYNLATQNCATQRTIENGSRDIIENQNAGTRAILEALNAQAIAAKDTKIAEQQAQINALNLAASQQAQNNYLISQLRQAPIPAYTVPNPYTGCNC